eukprot:CAMPEP_0206505762 /NCGR_PEP_ID=MMETSP0324_2-20121206/56345_1 /ASSEMBLY_ACC=CAM_ASM_000836 /TAXON_ID=2866 /ORGANISM="Crypthecodinium cohnii, Strain Seligo" /LENGTH=50 /DNA_ID=CAMNT_0053995327 /DNA_START=31 /DNA_END=179 /DNA_ORIENTATION=+
MGLLGAFFKLARPIMLASMEARVESVGLTPERSPVRRREFELLIFDIEAL